MVDAQEWLDKKFQEKNQVTNLTVTRNTVTGIVSWFINNDREKAEKLANQLIGSLNLNGFTNLQTLDCQNNKLSDELNVSGLTNLEILRCQNNQLTSLDVTNNKKLRTLICFNNPSLNKVTGLEDLINLSVIDCNNTGLRPINLLRQQIREVFSTGANDSNGKNHDIGYRDLINKEIEACQQVNNTSVPLEDIPKSQREQAEQEQSAYEAKISQINPWLQ